VDDFTLIDEYPLDEMPKRRLLELFRQGARLYQICENPACELCHEYQPILSDKELMTYCLRCAHKVLRYGVERK
jgi:hypothetical protein